MTPRESAAARWQGTPTTFRSVARNVSTRYLAILVEAALGLVVLPFNLVHLGQATYGLWMLAASVTSYFSVLDLGYAGAITKFVAHHRARHDAAAINEILSTLLFLFALMGSAVVAAAWVVGGLAGRWFGLAPVEAETTRRLLLIIALQVGAGLPFSVYGGLVNGLQRYDLNNLVGTASSIAAAAVNVVVLWAGLGVVPLVAATTGVRLLTLLFYRRNAARVFPALRISPSLVRLSRLREVTEFSVFVAVLDWAAKVNFSLDAVVIGTFLGPAAVAAWTVSQRLVEGVQRLTTQLNNILFPAVVDCDATRQADRLRALFVHGTRLSLASVLPAAVAVALLARPLLEAWVGPRTGNIVVTQVLAAVAAVRVGSATASTVLKGAGRHRFLAAASIAAAAVNLVLSVLLAPRFGLPGVAVGTLVPVSIVAVLVILPAACRRIDLPLGEVLRHAIWPAAWPAAVVAIWLATVRSLAKPSLLSVGLHGAAAGLLYLALFVTWGLPRRERRFYATKVMGLFSRRLEATT